MNMGHRKSTLIRSNVLWGDTTDSAYPSTMSHLMKSSFDTSMLKFNGKMPPQLAQRLVDVYLGRLQG
ncbi:hypothetical protein JZ785_04755 [Alicyclobacillus curvatus]|nr:hypothetical protein JZ785_04755 [Alicyclobacillus curvatus]